jgi:hypothetical protein
MKMNPRKLYTINRFVNRNVPNKLNFFLLKYWCDFQVRLQSRILYFKWQQELICYVQYAMGKWES